MPFLRNQLDLARCPYCKVDTPTLHSHAHFGTHALAGGDPRQWKAYGCSRCGGVVIASSVADGGDVIEFYPKLEIVDTAIPEPARSYLQQAVDSLHAPAGSVMLCASAVDAMLKSKVYTEGSLYSRIDQASVDHLITTEMTQWAHEVRLDANAQRHADEVAPANVEYAALDDEATRLAEEYVRQGALSPRMIADAQHIAVATVARVDVLVSWNFKHIVNLDRIHRYNSVNLREGYALLEIRSPQEVLQDESEDQRV